MPYKPYRCGVDCRGGYYCLICLFVFNLRKIWTRIKKIRTKKSALEKTPSTMDAHQNTEDG